MGKRERHKAILEVVREEQIPNQEALRARLRRRGFDVAQATLSRDIRELGLVKGAGANGRPYYHAPDEGPHGAALKRLLPDLFLSADGTKNLLLLRTLVGGAQPIGVALDGEQWPEVLGTIAGDDTVLVILRDARHLSAVRERLEKLAGGR